jgi:hypothetical protein
MSQGIQELQEYIQKYDGDILDDDVDPGQIVAEFGIVWKDNNLFGYKIEWISNNREKWDFLESLRGRGRLMFCFTVEKSLLNDRVVNDLLSRD